MAAIGYVAPAVLSASGVTPTFETNAVTTLAVDITTSSIVGGGAITVFVERQGLDGNWYSMNGAGTAISTATQTSIDVVAKVLSGLARVRWVLTGTSINAGFSLIGR